MTESLSEVYEPLARRRERLDAALSAAQSVQVELPGPSGPQHEREVSEYVDGKISAAELLVVVVTMGAASWVFKARTRRWMATLPGLCWRWLAFPALLAPGRGRWACRRRRDGQRGGMILRDRMSSKTRVNISAVSTYSWKPWRLALEPSAIRS
jgi:hypothetical protein